MTEMIVTLQQLIEALRNELQQYGEMLALLDHQQELVMLQGADDILHSISAVDSQSGAIQAARANRQLAQRNLAEKLSEPRESTFAHLIPLIPEQYRPLVTALVQENNELLQRVRQRAQQNHLLLRHSLDMMQRFISTLSPPDSSLPASPEQNSAVIVGPGSPQYQAIV
jgi:hypothetical protein